MQRKLRHLLACPQLWLLGIFGIWLILSLVCVETPAVIAAPYTVRKVNHPFDPDWPDVYLILSTKCVGCHRPGREEIDFTSYETILHAKNERGRPVIVPGKAENSALYRQVVWNHSANPNSTAPDKPAMPEKPEEWLTAGQIASIKRWIERGALEYKLPQTCSTRPLLEIDFPSAKECRICHPKQYKEWSRSMHAYAQHSPIFEAFNLTLIERTSGTIGTFCTRCHTPIGTALGESGSRRNVHRSRLSMEGVTCAACHRIKRPYYKSNSRMAIVPGKLLNSCMFGPFDDPVDIGDHPAEGGSFLKNSAFCGSCHDVTFPTGTRLEEAFSEWRHSPAAKQGITCQHCHMGPIQGVPIADCERPLGRAAQVPGVAPELIPLRHLSDHTFAGPDFSLLPDTEFPEKLDWMYEVDYRDFSKLTAYQQQTLNSLRRRNRRQLKIATQKRYELLQNAAGINVKAPRTARCGSKINIHVEIKSLFSGHHFPTGFTAERQAWIELRLTDPHGQPVLVTGDLDANGDLRDNHSHFVERGKLPYDRDLFNLQNKFVALTNKGTERSVIISVNRHLTPLNIVRPADHITASFGRPGGFRIAKGSLPAERTMGKNYSTRLPKCRGDYHLQVRLNFRHLPPALLDKIGTPHLKHLLEIVVIDEFESVIAVY
jgi:hypothetical protein